MDAGVTAVLVICVVAFAFAIYKAWRCMADADRVFKAIRKQQDEDARRLNVRL